MNTEILKLHLCFFPNGCIYQPFVKPSHISNAIAALSVVEVCKGPKLKMTLSPLARTLQRAQRERMNVAAQVLCWDLKTPDESSSLPYLPQENTGMSV